MYRRKVKSFNVLSIMFLVLFQCNYADDIGLTSSLYKIRRDLPLKSIICDSMYLYIPRNGSDAFQIVVHNSENTWKQTEIIINNFEHTNGVSTISRDNISINPVGHVIVCEGREGLASESWWPDPLLKEYTIDIDLGELRCYWVTISVPDDAESGYYFGNIIVKSDGVSSVTLTVKLKVWDFKIPQIPPVKFVIGLDLTRIARFYGIEYLSDDYIYQWVSFFADRGIHADKRCGSYHWGVDPMEVIGPPKPVIVNRQLCSSNIIWGGRLSNKIIRDSKYDRQEYENKILEALPDIVDSLSSYGWLDEAILYMYDELSKGDAINLLDFYKRVKEQVPELKMMQTFLSNRGLLGYQTPIDIINEYVDIWNVHMIWYKRNRSYVNSLRQNSEQEWWWYFTKHGPPWANIIINDPSILSHRMLPWLTKVFGFKAVLHWESAFFPDQNLGRWPRWPLVPWEASVKRDHKYIYQGNGYLVYPGFNINPLSSIRLEAIRHGLEDVKILKLLEELCIAANEKDVPQKLIARARDLINPIPELIQDVDRFNRDPSVFMKYRVDIGETIVELKKYVN